MDNETNQDLSSIPGLNQNIPPEQKTSLKLKVIVLIIVGVLILAGLCIGGYYYFNRQSTSQSSTVVSEIKMVNGVPKIFVNGEEFEVVAAQTYNQPPFKFENKGIVEFKAMIDAEKAVGANLVLTHLWWSELDKSTSRPSNLGDNLDFSYLDQAMNYAEQKGMKVMLLTGMHTMIPEWWATEQGFSQTSSTGASICMPKEIGKSQTCIPKELCTASDKTSGYCCGSDTKNLICCDVAKSEADMATNPPTPPKAINITADYKIMKCSNIIEGTSYTACSSCETDNYGWKYNNPSIGYDKAREDYGEYLTAVINHFKNNPALLGWQMQLGYSGEDYYGPNSLAFQWLTGSLYAGDLSKGRLADYSKVFQDSFKVWLGNKYKTTATLQSAWGDTTVSLENFKIPVSSEFFVGDKKGPFPDEGYLNFLVKLDDLSQKGKDFYEFREYMKTKDSKYYSSLFKSLDPNHVLFFNAYDNANEYTDTNINGYFLNNRLNAARSEENYLQVLVYAIIAGKYSQLGLPAWENIGGISNEDQNQLDVMEEAGKAMKCFGYGFGYVADISGTEMPSWKSENAKKVIKNIIAYTPTENCKCEIINKSDTLKGKTMKQMLAMYKITDYDYCANSSNKDTNTGATTQGNTTTTTQGKCGDGVCDSFEKSSGMCRQDCK